MATNVRVIPTGMHHLRAESVSKFQHKTPPRVPKRPKKFVQPRDRIARWNVVPGDKVRLRVGKPDEKWMDVKQGSKGGWKVYTVASVDMHRNRVFLEGLTNKKPSAPQPLPDDFDQLPPEQQKEWREQKNYISTRRPVDYSNVQLCVEDKGAESVFATRVSTSSPYFATNIRRWVWTRYASKLSGESSATPEAESGQVKIPWPKVDKPKPVDATPWDTLPETVKASTLKLGDAASIPAPLVPLSLRAPPPADQVWADEYIFHPQARLDKEMQAAMPLYLSEELSPRFSRAKKQRGWRERQVAEEEARVEAGRLAVEEWEANGRDSGLEEVLQLDLVGLEGVQVRSRTRKEVREAAMAEFDADLAESKKANSRARALGQVFDYEYGSGYEEGPKGIALERKRSRKERKARKIEERLQNLTLADEKNQVVPPDLRS